jgi:hypothetical protein
VPVQFDLLGIGAVEAVALPFLLEARDVGPLGEEVGVRAFQIFQRLLERMNRRVGPSGPGRPGRPGSGYIAKASDTEVGVKGKRGPDPVLAHEHEARRVHQT